MDFTRCYGCMRELPAPGAVCPRCGYDNTNDPGKQPSHVLPCGTVLNGKFIIGRVLGQGGFGITYIAWNLVLEKRVCIKEYFPSGAAMRSATQSQLVLWSGDENSRSLKANRESFIKEARKAVKLSNLSSVVEVLDVFYENETAYIVMDYIEGETLKSRMVRTQMTLGEEECVTLLAPMMEDMGRAHQQGIIHRDIKPDNIMLRTDGSPVLLDMGAAKDLSKTGTNNRRDLSQGQSPDGDNPENVLPTTNAVSHGFSPMEQYSAKSENIGSWTDVYAMSATILYCVSGKVPPAANERAIGAEIRYDGVSPAFAEVLDKGLAFQAQDRIQTMGELLEALRAAVKMEKDYQTAKELMGQKDAESLKKAAAIFKEISQYRDSKVLYAECMKSIHSRKPRYGLLAIAAVLVLIAVCVYTFMPRTVTITDNSGNTYVGLVKDDLYNGQGTMTYANGDKYVGEWENGKRNGQGIITFAEDDAYNRVSYEGEWVDANRCGQGTMKWKNGSVYTGEWKDGQMNGQGTMTFAEDDAYNRVSYEGEWVDANRCGQGTMKWKNGNVYTGKWKDGQMNGQGTMTYSENDKDKRKDYVGEWKADKRSGQGTLTWTDGGVYTGEWENDQRNGQGTMKWKNGEVYTGEWRNGKRTGPGTLTDANGSVKNQLWIEDQIVEDAERVSYPSGEYYGQTRNGSPEGLGMFTWSTGTVYWGGWKNGLQHGTGTTVWENGDIFIGEYVDGKQTTGTKTLADGTVEYWDNSVDETSPIESTEELFRRGLTYYNGNGVEQDYAKAMEWFLKAADGGNVEAMNYIGVMYYYGRSVERDYAEAFAWTQKAADGGNTNAMYKIGVMYANGRGVEQDYARAMDWYLRAADGGDTDAMNNIGLLYVDGRGVEKDYAKAMEWFLKAADGGNAKAMNNVGQRYRNGEGVTQDYTKAMEWYLKAVNGGSTAAMAGIGVLYHNGQGVEQSYEKAMEWYLKGANAGDAWAMYDIGNMYENGHGVEQDYGQAFEWYRKAADAGSSIAMYSIGRLYETGNGVTKDPDTAMEWYRKAANAGYSLANDKLK